MTVLHLSQAYASGVGPPSGALLDDQASAGDDLEIGRVEQVKVGV